MNIQIYGKSKCFDTKKAERWFKERRIKFQSIDLVKYGMSGKEFDSVLRAVGAGIGSPVRRKARLHHGGLHRIRPHVLLGNRI